MAEPKLNWNGYAVVAMAVSVLAVGSAAACAGLGSFTFGPDMEGFALRTLLPIGVLALAASVGFFIAGRRKP